MLIGRTHGDAGGGERSSTERRGGDGDVAVKNGAYAFFMCTLGGEEEGEGVWSRRAKGVSGQPFKGERGDGGPMVEADRWGDATLGRYGNSDAEGH